jgi:hypothetical protein
MRPEERDLPGHPDAAASGMPKSREPPMSFITRCHPGAVAADSLSTAARVWHGRRAGCRHCRAADRS